MTCHSSPSSPKLIRMSDRSVKQALYGQFARIGSALANDHRLELLDLLAQGPRNVEALATETEMSVANVSQHLRALRNARLVDSHREGTRVVYRLADGSVLRLWLALRGVGESRLAEVGELGREHDIGAWATDTISRAEFEAMGAGERAILIDVRPRVEYEHGHLPGALSLPVEELDERLEDLPRDRRIVAYCRGSYCLFAAEAVARLRERGFDAVRLDDGWTEWVAERADAAAK